MNRPAVKSRSLDDQIRSALHPFLHVLDSIVEYHICAVSRSDAAGNPLERGLTLCWSFPTFLKDFGPWRKGDRVYELTLHLDTWQLVETDSRNLLLRECPVSVALTTVPV